MNGDVGVKGERRWDTQDGEGEGRIVESTFVWKLYQLRVANLTF